MNKPTKKFMNWFWRYQSEWLTLEKHEPNRNYDQQRFLISREQLGKLLWRAYRKGKVDLSSRSQNNTALEDARTALQFACARKSELFKTTKREIDVLNRALRMLAEAHCIPAGNKTAINRIIDYYREQAEKAVPR